MEVYDEKDARMGRLMAFGCTKEEAERKIAEEDMLGRQHLKVPKNIYLKQMNHDGVEVVEACFDAEGEKGVGKDSASAIGNLIIKSHFNIIRSKKM